MTGACGSRASKGWWPVLGSGAEKPQPDEHPMRAGHRGQRSGRSSGTACEGEGEQLSPGKGRHSSGAEECREDHQEEGHWGESHSRQPAERWEAPDWPGSGLPVTMTSRARWWPVAFRAVMSAL